MWLCCQAGQDRAAAGDHGTLLTESSNLSAAGSGCLWKRVGVQMYKVSKLTDKRAANLRGCVAKWDAWVSPWGLEEVLYRRGARAWSHDHRHHSCVLCRPSGSLCPFGWALLVITVLLMWALTEGGLCEGFAQIFSLSRTPRAERNTAVGENGTPPVDWVIRAEL